MTPKPQALRPEDESERADAATPVAEADGAPVRPLHQSSATPAAGGAVVQRHVRDDAALTDAIAPLVNNALLVSVRDNPRVLVDALFPIILPAISRAVAGMLRGLVQSLNQVLEQSLTLRGLRWRIESWRTGRPVGEIALRDSLVYRVEQVLLIHSENGILLQSAGDDTAADPDLMSALLTAIRDFGRESFGGAGEDEFPELPTGGGRHVLVEQGPRAVLAAVVRGNAAPKLREVMQDAIGEIQRWYSDRLIRFDGNTEAFEGCKPYLEQCLESEYRREKQSLTPAYVFLAATAAIGLLLAVLTIWPRWKWGKYLERLRAEPGIAVIDAGRAGGKFHAEILRDPLAADPEIYLFDAGFGPDDAELRVEPILSFHPQLVVRRATASLAPPDGVRLGFKEGTLVAAGSAPASWITGFRSRARTIPGVDSYDDSQLIDATVRLMGELAREIEAREIRFDIAKDAIGGQEQVIDAWARDLKALKSAVESAGSARTAIVRVIGQADETGTEGANLSLSRRRARQVVSALREKGIDTAPYEVTGIGEQPIQGEGNAADPRSRRRVVIRVSLLEGKPGSGATE